ncbi:hypothetical protein [Kribbella sp. NPDC055071]
MDTNLSHLMNKATEDLEPVSTDLYERSLEQGLRLRRRRTTILSVTGAGAVLATAGIIVGGLQALGGPNETAAASMPIPEIKPTAVAKPSTPATVTPKQTLATLRSLIQNRGTLSQPQTWGSAADGLFGASYVIDDGKGAAQVDVMLSGGGDHGEANPCQPVVAGCTKLSDGSWVHVLKESPEYSDGRQQQEGVVANYVIRFFPDGRNINLTSYNAPAEKGQQHTRPKPTFTTDELVTMAKSKAWKFPPAPANQGSKPTK